MLFASAITRGGCGGDDNLPTPISDVITVKKVIPRGSNAALKEVQQVDLQYIKILEVRRALMFPPRSDLITTGTPDFVVLLDVSAADAEKTKMFG